MKGMLSIIGLLLLSCFNLEAQNRSLSGVVNDSENKPVVSATVKVKGSASGTSTNADGRFSLQVPAGSLTLEISSIGFATKEVAVGANDNEITVSLAAAAQELGEVVVTALGITKQKRALSSSVTDLKVEDLTKARTNNIMNGLAGKVAGVNITSTATGAAGSSRVVIRGNTSLNGSNQPLYVIDGVPIDNTNRGSAGEWGGSDAGDGIQSINPDEVETMSVLKGGSAAALYGSRASNGVILITTKKGSKRKAASIEINSNIGFEQPTSYTDWQYEYGHGTGGAKPTTADQAASINLNSWGAKLDGTDVIQFDGVSRPYTAQKDNMKNFYETGNTLTNSLAISGGSERSTYYFTASDLNNKSFIPNSTLRRNNFSLNTSFNPVDKLNVNVGIRYIRERVKNRPRLSDSPGNANFSVFLLPTSMDVRTLKESMTTPDGSERKWQGNDYVTNPYWATEKFQQHDERDRYIGSIETRYDFTKWLYARARIGVDQYTLTNFAITPYGTRYSSGGEINDQSKLTFSEFNAEGLLGVNKSFGDIGLDAFVGGNRMIRKDERTGLSGSNFFGPDFYNQSNLANKNPYYGFNDERINSVFGSVDLSYKRMVYLTATGRNDWFSTLSPDDWSIFYPSVGVSFVLSEAVNMPSWVNFTKIRTSWAQVGGDSDPYQLALSYRYSLPYGSLPVAGIAQSQIPNAGLKPYTLTTYEAGLEARFAKSRIGVDFTFYTRRTTDDIVASQLSQSTGFNSIVLNVGSVRNRGFELLLNGTLVKTNKLTWDVTLNGGYNTSEVEELYQDLNSIRIASARSFTGFVDHIIGKPYGQVLGYKYKRNNNGELLLKDGLPQRGELFAFGSGVAPLTTGITNSLRYGNLNLSVLIDGKFGGKIYSGTNDFATYRGAHRNTLIGREDGIVAEGIDETTGSKNTTEVSVQPYYQSIGLNISEDFIYKSDFIKLRQVILSYELPSKMFEKTPFKGVSVSAIARNLAILKKYIPNVDPESTYNSGNGQGLEWFGAPQMRSYGLNLNVKF